MKQSECKNRFPLFKERFTELRGDMSNTEFAHFLSISRQTVGFYINGERVPDILGLLQISEKCNVSADWLLGLSDVKTTDTDMKQICAYTGLSEPVVNWLHAFKGNSEYFPFVANLISRIVLTDTLQESVEAMVKASASLAKGISAIDSSEKDNKPKWATTADIINNALFAHDDYLMKITANDAMKFYKSTAINVIQEAVEAAVIDYCQDKTQIFIQLRTLASESNISPTNTTDI